MHMSIHYRKITAEQIHEKYEVFEKVKLLDISAAGAFDLCHIPKSINIPAVQITKLAPCYLDKGDEIVIYGENPSDPKPALAVESLYEEGFSNLFLYEGGIEHWIKIGNTVESVVAPQPACFEMDSHPPTTSSEPQAA